MGLRLHPQTITSPWSRGGAPASIRPRRELPMNTPPRADRSPARDPRKVMVLLGAIGLASLTTVSAHIVKGLDSPDFATAFVSSPTAPLDPLIKIGWGDPVKGDTGLRVACFYVANTSRPRPHDPRWPRVTAVG